MELTTGLILRRITQTQLSASAHKLATLILDGVSWKDGYNGLPRGTAAFTLSALATKMAVSRQYLSTLLGELAASDLKLEREKPNGKYAPWVFRFSGVEEGAKSDRLVSTEADTSLYEEDSNKTVFSGHININDAPNVYQTPWAEVIKQAKLALPCWSVDTQTVWERFLAFNRARSNSCVPAGYLLGFMRKWRTSGVLGRNEYSAAPPSRAAESCNLDQLQAQIKAAPSSNRHFHAGDLTRLIGKSMYERRIDQAMLEFSCTRFAAALAVHGQAVAAGEIGR